MYVNAKMISEEGIKRVGDGVNPSVIYFTHCKNFCKCHNVSPYPTKNKNRLSYEIYL
jgi:hypothetical protein